jgi:dCMP deaminase
MAIQTSDQMTCPCGNVWDMNDPSPPDCSIAVKRTQEEWDGLFMRLALDVAHMSKDPNRRVGAVIVTPNRRQLSFGYNGFPKDIPDTPALLGNKAFKREHIVHAEDNCLQQTEFNPRGCTLYVTRFPCNDCAVKLREARIGRVVSPRPDYDHEFWGSSWSLSTAILLAANITISH